MAPRPVTARPPIGAKQPAYRCHACAATFTAWAPAERHADAERHHRIEVIVHRARTQPGR